MIQQPVTGRQILILSTGIVGLVVVLCGALLFAGKQLEVTADSLWVLLTSTLALLSTLLVVLMASSYKKMEIPANELGLIRPSMKFLHLLWQGPVILAVAVLLQILTMLLFAKGQAKSNSSNSFDDLLASAPNLGLVVLFAVTMSVLTPVWEELFFRGFMFSWLNAKLNVFLTILAIGIVFALVHGMVLLTPYYLVIGAGLTWLRYFHGNIWAPLAMHISLNSLVVVIALVSYI